MDVTGEGQALAAALNHAAFNAANALGPRLGGLAVRAGWGLTSTGWIAAALALAGFVIWLAAIRDARRAGDQSRPAVPIQIGQPAPYFLKKESSDAHP